VKALTTIGLVQLSSPPSSPYEGETYFDTTQDAVGVYTGSSWTYLSAGGGASNISGGSSVSTYLSPSQQIYGGNSGTP
jgi:hypothetical protein